MQVTSLMTCEHFWLLNKEYLAVDTDLVSIERQQTVPSICCNQRDSTANGSKFITCKTLCFFSETPCILIFGVRLMTAYQQAIAIAAFSL